MIAYLFGILYEYVYSVYKYNYLAKFISYHLLLELNNIAAVDDFRKRKIKVQVKQSKFNSKERSKIFKVVHNSFYTDVENIGFIKFGTCLRKD